MPSLKSCKYLLHLVNGILDFTQITLNKKPAILIEKMSIRSTINDVIDLLQMKADIRNIKLRLEIGENVPK